MRMGDKLHKLLGNLFHNLFRRFYLKTINYLKYIEKIKIFYWAYILQKHQASHPKDKAKSRAIGRRKATDLNLDGRVALRKRDNSVFLFKI